jgi:hypothetical protein
MVKETGYKQLGDATVAVIRGLVEKLVNLAREKRTRGVSGDRIIEDQELLVILAALESVTEYGIPLLK